MTTHYKLTSLVKWKSSKKQEMVTLQRVKEKYGESLLLLKCLNQVDSWLEVVKAVLQY